VRDVNEGARIAKPSCETEVDEMDKANGGAPPDKNILGFDIAVNDVSRVDEFQMEKLVLKKISSNKNQ
jgi:hypothetical protein